MLQHWVTLLLVDSNCLFYKFLSFEFNFNTKRSIWSDQFYKILGVTPHKFSISPTTFLKYIHPDDIESYLTWAKNIADYTQNIEINK